MRQKQIVIFGWMLFLACAAAAPQAKKTFSESVRGRIAATLDQLQIDGDFTKAKTALIETFDQVIAYAPPKDTESFREADFALRLVSQLEKSVPASRLELLKYLRAHDNLARNLAFLIRPGQNAASIYAMLDRMRRERGDLLEEYATLTAAICVVHDRPLSRHINENGTKSPDALAIFDYFVKNEKQMFFGIKPVPAEMLIYVVDTTSSIEEMDWALANYDRDPKVGARFFDIRYDFDHLRHGTPKRVSSEGFTLQNILKYGGVCADQAYFATSVGKAIGVPTCYTTGAAGETAHAWVGFLQAKDRQGWWNFDVGRYEAYRGVRGTVLDPQMREGIPDSYVSLLAELIPTRQIDRHTAVALTDAAWRLIELEHDGKKFTPIPPATGVIGFNTVRVRKATVEFELELLEQAVRLSPGDRGCWLPIRELAKAGRLKLDMKKHWADVLEKLCGQNYPDFMLAILGPMIQTVEDAAEQNRLWDRTFDMFRNRADLAASIRMAQAAMWEKQKKIDEAGFCYMDVIERYANAGPFVLDALQRAEKALRDYKRADRVPMLYKQAWEKIHRPKEMASPYMVQSNWYRVGQLYAAKLSEAGKTREADAVRQELGVQGGVATPERPQ